MFRIGTGETELHVPRFYRDRVKMVIETFHQAGSRLSPRAHEALLDIGCSDHVWTWFTALAARSLAD